MRKKLKIALAEDNRFHALLFERAVTEQLPGSQVSVFGLGQTLLPALKNDHFDLVAIDTRLPDIDGLELLSLIRADDTDIPVIVITGEGSERTTIEAMKTGATDYIAKTGDFEASIPRIIKQAYRRQQLLLKARRLETKAREAEKLETVTTMASTLNHEINNPLMAILGNVELLLQNPAALTDELRGKLEMIEISARRIQQITYQMANLMTTNIKQTPVGPMLRLEGEDINCSSKTSFELLPVDKTD